MSKDIIDCACLIHGDLYPWKYVENLYAMVVRNFSCQIRFHVFTERERAVPDHMIKHTLQDWPGVSGRRRAWWYKLQMFDPRHVAGQLLYFDLDVVITGELDWIRTLPTKFFWTIRDFRYLYRPAWQGINSSVMWWNVSKFDFIWRDFESKQLATIMRQYAGDQDYLTAMIPAKRVKHIDEYLVKSWRWQVKDGGMDMKNRVHLRPDAGSIIIPGTRIVVFHGDPKPHQIQDPEIQRYWNAD